VIFQRVEAVKLSGPSANTPNLISPKYLREPHVPEGSLLGTIEIQSVGVRAVVLQGDSSEVLRRGVGHVPGTPLPGEAGNVALAAHRDTIFRPLRNIKTGDLVVLRTNASSVAYRVRSTEIVPPTDIDVLDSRGTNELTLITCYPFYYVGHAPDRFIVRASEVDPGGSR